MKTAEELKRAISHYAVGYELPVEEFVEIAEAIDALCTRLAFAEEKVALFEKRSDMFDRYQELAEACIEKADALRAINSSDSRWNYDDARAAFKAWCEE